RCPHCDAQFAWTIRRLSLPGHHPARLGLGAPQDATGAERCAVSVGPVDRMFATPPDSPGQCEPGLSDDRSRDPRLCYCPELSPRGTRSSSSCSNVSPIAAAAPGPAASSASFEG